MTRADKAALRLTIGLGVAVLVAYGFALPVPFVVCVMAVILLCKPGPPMPLAEGRRDRSGAGRLLTAGVLMVPVLENYALTGLLLTATILYAVFYTGLRAGNPADDGAGDGVRPDPGGRRGRPGPGRAARALTIAVGVVIGGLVKGVSHALLSGPTGLRWRRSQPRGRRARQRPLDRAARRR